MTATTDLAEAIPHLQRAEAEFWESLRGKIASDHWRDHRRDALIDLVKSIEMKDGGRVYRLPLFGDDVFIGVVPTRLADQHARSHSDTDECEENPQGTRSRGAPTFALPAAG